MKILEIAGKSGVFSVTRESWVKIQRCRQSAAKFAIDLAKRFNDYNQDSLPFLKINFNNMGDGIV